MLLIVLFEKPVRKRNEILDNLVTLYLPNFFDRSSDLRAWKTLLNLDEAKDAAHKEIGGK